MRAFVALDIPDPKVLDALLAFQKELAGTGADLKLVERENLHFTVKFLGEVSDGQAKEAVSRLLALKLSGADVAITGVGAFPNTGRPNVVWAGVPREDEAKVNPVAHAVIQALEGIGESDRRPFQAHITLARVRSGRNRQALEALLRTNSDREFGVVRLATIKLKSSVLTPKGPVYGDLAVCALT